ncbi:HAD-IA family hydrolase [Streptomyces sp. NPDC012794]|uniref:HAD-IA family hydrolase n=1 Tax=Streptomyces sp. NPDC012794 TaxID=3364850 RepID=UPI00369971D9
MANSTAPAAGRPFDALLCDLDNVIRFYDPTRLAELERLAGLPEGTTAAVAFSPELDGPLLLGRITRDEWRESIADALARSGRIPDEGARELAGAMVRSPFTADAAVVSVLRGARAGGLPLVLVTNASLDLEEDLAVMGIADLADHVVSSAVEGVAKPDREIYAIAAARAGVAPGRCLFVDDRPENVEAAVAFGMTGVHYRGPADLRAALAFLS